MSDRHEMQAAGTHPAPCARHCEAKAYEIEIRRLRHDIERRVRIATEATQESEQLRAELAACREREARMQSRDAQWVAFALEVGRRVGCLASTFPDANDHVLRKLPPPAALAEGAQG